MCIEKEWKELYMEIILQILGVIIFLCSTYGFCYVAHKKIQVQMNFVVIFVLSSIAIVTYLGGILFVLSYSVYATALVGVGCFIYAAIDIKKNKLDFSWVAIYKFAFAFCTIVVLMFLLEIELEHYDNYSHWGIVVKDMLINEAFPTMHSNMIEFKNYPLGTASYIYYVCKIVGQSQGVMLFAQGTLIFACFYAMFGIITEVKRFLLYIFMGATLSFLAIFNIAIRMNNLLVDFLLPILALAAIASIYRYRYELNKGLIIVTPILSLLMIVKSTGVIFASVPILYLFYITIKYRMKGETILIHKSRVGKIEQREGVAVKFIKMIITTVVSFVPLIIWNLHMKWRFAGVENKFEVSSEVVSKGVGGKTPEEVEFVVDLFLHRMFDIQDLACKGILGYVGCALLACIFARVLCKKKWALGKVTILMLVFVMLYYVGILGMYVFSMPMYEAEFLAGYERYASSIVILLGGVLAMCATIDIENSFYYKIGNKSNYKSYKSIFTKRLYNYAVVGCLCTAFLVLISEYNGMVYNKRHFKDSFAYIIKEQVGDSWEEQDDTKYLVLAPDRNGEVTNGYVTYVSRYYLYTDNVDAICALYEDNLLNLLSQYDTLIIVEEQKEDQELMQKYFGVDGSAGMYDTKVLLRNIQM